MSLNNIKSKFEEGKISKPEYIDEMYSVHQSLFDYSKFIENTEVRKIEIQNGKVIFFVKPISGSGEIKIECVKGDKRTTALEIMNFGNYESGDSNLLFKLIRKDDVIFDIGANIGWYTINFSNVLTEGKVYAFEPIPETYSYLLDNIKINSVKNIEPSNIALSNSTGETEFFYNPEELGASSAKQIKESSGIRKIICKTMTIEDFFVINKIEKLDLIKCDVEGGEYFVFKGGVKIIEKQKPIVFTEMLRKWSAKFSYHPNDIMKLFSDIGYKCFIENNEKLKEIKEVDDNTTETNFFFLHPEKHQDQLMKYSLV